jgi:hypothetical protein
MKLVYGAAVMAVLSLSACDAAKQTPAPAGSDTANVGPSSGAPASGTTTTTTTTTPASGTGGGATIPTLGSTAGCHSGDLALTHVSEDAGAGQREVVYAFTNNGQAACSLAGYPTLVFFDANGKRLDSITSVQSEDGDFAANGASPTVTLTPKGKAVFRIRFTGIQATDKPCANTARVRATPPGNAQAIELADALQICTGEVLISPVRPS